MKKGKLIILFFVLIIALIFLIWFNSQNTNTNIEEKQFVNLTEKNKSDVIWNGNNIIIYDDYLYFIDKKISGDGKATNLVCRKNLMQNTETEIIYASSEYSIQNRLMVYNNNLFFSVLNQTCFMNLNNLQYAKNINNGVLYYIQDGKMIYLYQNKIYKGEYYIDTLVLNSKASLANGNFKFMMEDEENLYFYSSNNDYSISILKVNKKNQYVNVLDRIYSNTKNNINVLDYIFSEDYIYVLFEKNLGALEYEYNIAKVRKDGTENKIITLKNCSKKLECTRKNDLYFKHYSGDEILKYDSKSDQIKAIEDDEKIGIYFLKHEDNKLNLYKNNIFISSICEIYQGEVTNINIKEYNNQLFIDFNVANGESMLLDYMIFKLNKDGTNIEKLNKNFTDL